MTHPALRRVNVIVLLVLCSSLAKGQDRPNVVFIMTDNHGAWTLGCYGNPDIRTPNIDQLSREGMLFERCFSSNPVCSPTRATWLTGLMPSQHGVHCFIHPKVQRGPEAKNTIEEFRSLPEILSGEGYTCGLSGKWHLGDHLKPHEGFSFWVTKPSGHTTEFYDQKIVENGEIREQPKYMTQYWTDRGIEFMEQNKDRPFFLYLAYNGPYGLSSLLLNESKNRHAEYYADKELLSFPRETMHPWLHRNRDYLNNPTAMRRYAAEVSGVDDGVGRVMAALKRLGLDDNTLVIFTADQGLAGGQSGIWGMGDHTYPGSGFDSTMHVPLVVRQPGKVKSNQRSSTRHDYGCPAWRESETDCSMVNRGKSAIPALGRALKHDNAITRRSAVWALCQKRSPQANQLLRAALEDENEHVRLAATRSLATLRDVDAVPELIKRLTSDTPAIRREAATALGRIGNAEAVDSLLTVLSGGCDRFLEHALICALIRIADRERTLPGLENKQPDVIRAVLIALDQMENGNLTREQVTPLLDIDDERLQRTVLNVIAKRKTWVGEVTGLMRSWLAEPSIPESRIGVTRGTLVAFAADTKIQQLIAQRLADKNLPVQTRLLLLEAIARSELTDWPAAWNAGLKNSLRSADVGVRQQTLATVAQANIQHLDDDISQLGSDANQPAALRVAALGILADHGGTLDDASIDLLIAQIDDDVDPLSRIAAANALGSAKLTRKQLHQVTELAGATGSLELPILLSAFEKASDEVTGQKLVAALSRSPALESLPVARVAAIIDRFPAGVRKSAEAMLKRLQVDSAEQAQRLEELMLASSEGDPVAGRRVFHGRKASCSACHRVGQEGGQVGPNLSEIARIRTPRDLLESIVFPSATLARGFETYAVVTSDGKVVTGTIQRETPEAVYLRTAQREEVRVPRADIEDLKRNNISIMPQGLDKTITQAELNDLMSYLRSLK